MAVNYETLKEIIVNWASTTIDTTALWAEYDDGMRSWNYRGNVAFFNIRNEGFGIIQHISVDGLQQVMARIEWRKRILEEQWCWDFGTTIHVNNIILTYKELKTREDYIRCRANTIRNEIRLSPTGSYKQYLANELLWVWPNLPSLVRNIYVKLLIEWKITEEEFVLLCRSRDAEVNLLDCYWITIIDWASQQEEPEDFVLID